MGTTADGYRWPEDSSNSNLLGQDIKALADDVDAANRRGTLAARPLASAVFPGTRYTVTSGASVGQVSISDGTQWWDLATAGHTHAEASWVGVQVSRYTDLTVPNGGGSFNEIAVPFTTEEYDPQNWFSLATPTILTCPADGWYQTEHSVSWTPFTTGFRTGTLKYYPSEVSWAAADANGGSGITTYNQVVRTGHMTAGDQFRLKVGCNEITDQVSKRHLLTIRRIGP